MKSKFITIILVLALIMATTGCQTAQRPVPNQPGTPGTPNRYETPRAPEMTPNRLNTPYTTDGYGIPGAPGVTRAPGRVGMNFENNYNRIETPDPRRITIDVNRQAQNIADQLTDMEPIERATVVISGNTALVGIDIVDNYYKYDEEEYLKDDLVNRIKTMAPGIINVAITESPDLFQRINNLSRSMANGRMVQGLTNEFTELVNKITPSTR